MAIIEATTVASVSKIALKLLEPVTKDISKKIIGFAKEKWVIFTTSLDEYLKVTTEKHQYFNSQIFSNEGKLLESYYVPLTLQRSEAGTKKSLRDIKVDRFPKSFITNEKNILIVDTAGMGKSTLLKYMYLQLIKEEKSIPIFIELRKLNKSKSIKAFVLDELNIGKSNITDAYLEKTLEKGLFTFFLDGYDEISDDDKKSVSTDILQFKSNFDQNTFILSSRDEPSLSSLNNFLRFNIKPLSRHEAFELINKISPVPETGKQLISKLSDNEQNNLNDFLTNPLLVSLLVKAFLHSNILPVRLSEFYRQVFDALYQNHDAKKELGGFSRVKKSKLDLDKFHRALRALGVLTYKKGKLEFTSDEFSKEIEEVKKLTSENTYSACDLQDDLLRAVPLFIPDGNLIRWAHRSLQEYFAASYICTDAKENQTKNLMQLYESSSFKNVNILTLCADIDGKTFKATVIQNYLKSLVVRLDSSYAKKNFPNIRDDFLAKRRGFLGLNEAALVVFSRAKKDFDWSELDRIATQDQLIKSGNWQMGQHFDSNFAPMSVEGNTKLVCVYARQQIGAIDHIIEKYFGVRITQRNQYNKPTRPFKNIQYNIMLAVNEDSENCLNSVDNFEITTSIISASPTTLYDEGRIRKLLNEIQHEESEFLSFDITF
ncbi:MAG: NACHT domain-containing NTPase [Candidatus Aquirickettsiella gammari]